MQLHKVCTSCVGTVTFPKPPGIIINVHSMKTNQLIHMCMHSVYFCTVCFKYYILWHVLQPCFKWVRIYICIFLCWLLAYDIIRLLQERYLYMYTYHVSMVDILIVLCTDVLYVFMVNTVHVLMY